ncbi:MAG: PilZ domain-containing protein [Pseudoalteromonas prydzensis]|uniref:PilZ domain-containing protein n=1 Tax=Pseudoalteromonas prydzensis TaxID=182141 RepID=UPI003F9D09C7
MKNRRHYTRILFSTPAHLTNNTHSYPCQLLDISLNGALVSRNNEFNFAKNSSAILAFKLPQSDIIIAMTVTICHIEQQHIGLKCTHIDIDSITHLKRLIELNLADDDLLHRELESLIHSA